MMTFGATTKILPRRARARFVGFWWRDREPAGKPLAEAPVRLAIPCFAPGAFESERGIPASAGNSGLDSRR
jgi:hypothetical protein